VDSPAALAENEVSDVDDVCDPVRGGLATLPTLDCFLIFHAPIVTKFVGVHIELSALIWNVPKVFSGRKLSVYKGLDLIGPPRPNFVKGKRWGDHLLS